MKHLILSIIQNILFFLEAFSVTFFLLRFCKCKCEERRMQVLVFQTMVMAVLCTWSSYIPYFTGFILFAYFPCILIFSILFLDGAFGQKLKGCLLVLCIKLLTLLAAVIITMRCGDWTLEELYYDFEWYKMAVMLLERAFQIVMFGWVLRAEGKLPVRMKRLEKGVVLSNLITSAITFGIIHDISYGNVSSEWKAYLFILSLLCLVIMNGITFYLMEKLHQRNELASDNKMLRQRVMYYESHLEQTHEQIEELKQMRHDIRHSYQLISNLASLGKNREIEQYISEVLDIVNREEYIAATGNEFVDSMLCYKLSYAAKKGIKVVHSVTAGLEGIENVDCCNLIGNLIDNAIEANLKLPEGKRKLELFIKGDPCKLFIRVRNILETSVLDTNSGLATQKKDKDVHGYGIRIIRKIATQYNGYVQFTEEEGFFCAEVMLFRRT